MSLRAQEPVHLPLLQFLLISLLLVLYVLIALYGPGRLPFKIKNPKILGLWYQLNCLFHLVLLVCFIPEMINSVAKGLYSSICITNGLYTGAISSVVVRLFAVSKILDLGETLLLVAVGRKPLLIHIFHHAVTVAVVYAQYPYEISLARWFVFLNLASHVILYAYLSPNKLCGLNPCWLSVVLAQISHLVVCTLTCFYARNRLNNGIRCDVSLAHLTIHQLLLAIFLILFIDFYHGKYLRFRQRRELRSRSASREDAKEKCCDSNDQTRNSRKTRSRPRFVPESTYESCRDSRDGLECGCNQEMACSPPDKHSDK